MGQISLKLAAVVTFLCALLELVVGLNCGSLALTTDSGYMASDACALFMAIIALRNKTMRSYMLWLSSIMMLCVVFYMLRSSIAAIGHEGHMMAPGVLIVSAIGLFINIWVSRGLVGMPCDHNIQVAHLHVICDMLGSAIAVVSGIMSLIGFDQSYDTYLSIFSGLGVGIATIILMYKMYSFEFSKQSYNNARL